MKPILITALTLFVLLTSFSASLADSTSEKVFILYSAEWCGPCRRLKPIVYSNEVRTLLRDKKIYFVEIDVDKYSDFAKIRGIDVLPTMTISEYDKSDNSVGRDIRRRSGLITKTDLMRWINSSDSRGFLRNNFGFVNE